MGNREIFWEDSWNGKKSLDEETEDREMKQILCDLRGRNVRNYMVERLESGRPF